MEVDIPANFAFGSSNGDASTSPVAATVQFNAITEVKTFAKPATTIAEDQRPKHKSRRRARPPKIDTTGGGSTMNGGGMHALTSPTQGGKPLSPSKLKKMAEKDRHSRTGRRGNPKKGGAGGKGTWGKLTEVYDEDGHAHDTNDPNYDSIEEDEEYVVSPSSPHMTLDEFEKKAVGLFKEYFEHGDTQEVVDTLNEYNIKNFKPEIIRVLVTLALEQKAANREKASVLISDLYGQVLNSREVANGFDLILQQLEDLVLDTPDVTEAIGNFIARCMADDCLAPAFVTRPHPTLKDSKAFAAMERAKMLISMKHGLARLDNVWGVGGGQRPVMFLIGKMNLLLMEFLSSGDKNEAVRCLCELEVPHFHHELVYEAIVMVLEKADKNCADMMCSLLQHMATVTVITPDQFNKGFMRVFRDMTDIVLDVPNAYHTLSKFVEKGSAAGFVSRAIEDELPSRGRKRYVSEGDGGAIKLPED